MPLSPIERQERQMQLDMAEKALGLGTLFEEMGRGLSDGFEAGNGFGDGNARLRIKYFESIDRLTDTSRADKRPRHRCFKMSTIWA
jgi:hypothetical protein